MEPKTIELKHKWQTGTQIGSGGFGRVYEAVAEDGSQAVVKLVPIAPGAARELLFEPIANHPNIIPILDSGEWQNFYVLVMPRAEISLRQHLQESGGRLSSTEAISVLIDVAEALASLEGTVVHRDLKPANILLYQGHWCLADFGIARYAEATTAPDTHKYAFSAPYAAPERWREQRATSATDVYAFGITAFELVQGHPPFHGSDFASYREQHLSETPPPVTGFPPSVNALVTECLYKPPQARPTPGNILERLRRSQGPASMAASRLQAANQMVVEIQAQEGAMESAQQSEAERRSDLFNIARQSFEVIVDELVAQIRGNASSASVRGRLSTCACLGQGTLTLDIVKPAPSNCLAAFGHPPAFDVVAWTTIMVRQPPDQFGYEGRSHSLWFCDAYDEGAFRWFEIAFMASPFSREVFSSAPFALSPTDAQAAGAFSPVGTARQLAWEPLPFDQGDDPQFIERWMGWFAEAVNGALRRPSHMPEESGGRYRRRHP